MDHISFVMIQARFNLLAKNHRSPYIIYVWFAPLISGCSIPDVFPVLAAAHNALIAKSRDSLTTRTLHSELVYNYSGSKHVSYELNVLGTRGPRRMHCIMHSIPASSLDDGGVVPGQPEHIAPRYLEDSFRSMSFSQSSLMDRSMDFGSLRFFDISGAVLANSSNEEIKDPPLVLRNKVPRWHEQLQCWCLNFRGRVTVASVKNFRLIAAN